MKTSRILSCRKCGQDIDDVHGSLPVFGVVMTWPHRAFGDETKKFVAGLCRECYLSLRLEIEALVAAYRWSRAQSLDRFERIMSQL